jgi:hypothetical protein
MKWSICIAASLLAFRPNVHSHEFAYKTSMSIDVTFLNSLAFTFYFLAVGWGLLLTSLHVSSFNLSIPSIF